MNAFLAAEFKTIDKDPKKKDKLPPSMKERDEKLQSALSGSLSRGMTG